MHNSFGGSWTEQKLQCLGAYMQAYNIALRKQSFQRVYIDLFAGSGKREDKNFKEDDIVQLAFDDLGEDEKGLFDGSARLALNTQPAFHHFFFGEKLKRNVLQLTQLQEEFPSKNIEIRNEDARELLPMVLDSYNWKNTRAIMFLDPFGAQVDWEMLVRVAETNAIDLFYLFPSGLVVNRLLKKDGNIPDKWKIILNRLLGTNEWEDAFYSDEIAPVDLFDNSSVEFRKKRASIKNIDQFFIKQLNRIFQYVGAEPLDLKTANGVHMFSLCFAISNSSGRAISLADNLWKGVLKSVQK
jgi:three-Cys-motif partner protein